MSNKLSTSSIKIKEASISRLPSKEGILNSSGFKYPPPLSQIELENMPSLLDLGNPPLLFRLGLANLLHLHRPSLHLHNHLQNHCIDRWDCTISLRRKIN